jgi:hypothetical protein
MRNKINHKINIFFLLSYNEGVKVKIMLMNKQAFRITHLKNNL